MNKFFTISISLLALGSASIFCDIDVQAATHYSAIVKIGSDDVIPILENQGIEILRRRDNLLLCYIPLSTSSSSDSSESESLRRSKSARKLNKTPGIIAIEPGREVAPTMDIARTYQGAYKIYSGEGLPGPYTGHGIVTGICDSGLDPLQINFYDEEGNNRIKRITQYTEAAGLRVVLNSEQEYAEWITDNSNGTHGTHVAGIMAGSYTKNGYQGMAPDADIVLSCSQLSDVGLLCGAEDILEYAKQVNRPAVINMSMGYYLGPHDGTSLFSQYLDKIGSEAIVILSAGNAGNYTNTASVDFSDSLTTAEVALSNYKWTQFDMYGETDVWSANSAPLRARIGVYDENDRVTVHYFPWQDLSEDNEFVLTSTDDDYYDETFANYFSGWAGFLGGIDEESGRYRIIMQYTTHTDEICNRGPWARWLLSLQIEADPETHADFYADGVYTKLTTIPGGPTTGSLQSFSDLSSGYNLVSVGMYVNRDSAPSVSGDDFQYSSVTPGTISNYSGYATLLDGRVMPLTVAPGGNVISSYSTPYIEDNPDNDFPIVAQAEENGRNNYWLNNSGTSMSAPYVAGAIATWLEANPALTIKNVQQIISQTNITDLPDPTNPRHGQGWFNPYEGLKKAIGIASAENNISYDEVNPKLSYNAGTLTIWNPASEPGEITISDISGRNVLSAHTADSLNDINISSLPAGLFIATLRTPFHTSSLKFLK